jgi:hypothetical protein
MLYLMLISHCYSVHFTDHNDNNLNSTISYKNDYIAGGVSIIPVIILSGLICKSKNKKLDRHQKALGILHLEQNPNFHPDKNKESIGYNNGYSNSLRRALVKIADGTHSDLMPELTIEGKKYQAKSPLINNSSVCFPALRHKKAYKNSMLVLSRFKSQSIKSFSKYASDQEILDLINLVKRVKKEYTDHSSRQIIYCNGPKIASSADHMHVQIRFNLDEGHNTNGRKITDAQWNVNYINWDEGYYSHIDSSNSYNVFVRANNPIFGKGKHLLIQAKKSSDKDSIATLRHLHKLIPNHGNYRVYWQFEKGRLMFVIKYVSKMELNNLDFKKL